MTVIWLSKENDPIPTAPAILTERLVHRAMVDPVVGTDFEVRYRVFEAECGPELRAVLNKAHRLRSVGPEWTSEELQTRAHAIFEPWCQSWGGLSNEILGQAVTVAVLRFYPQLQLSLPLLPHALPVLVGRQCA